MCVAPTALAALCGEIALTRFGEIEEEIAGLGELTMDLRAKA